MDGSRLTEAAKILAFYNDAKSVGSRSLTLAEISSELAALLDEPPVRIGPGTRGPCDRCPIVVDAWVVAGILAPGATRGAVVPVESVEVGIVSDGPRLAGTLLLPPEQKGGALFLNGSGPLDRDSNMDGQQLDVAKTFAHALADAGWASLRFDKRGVGDSTGDALTGGFDDETDDAEAALHYLRTTVDGLLVVLGHSVGGTIAIRLAANHPVDGVVLLATPAQPLCEVAQWQTDRISDTLPGPSWLAPRLFKAAQRRGWSSIERSTGDTIRGVLRRQPARWFREALAYDPAPDIAALTCSVLAVTGGKDLQVDAADVATIGAAVKGPFRGETPPDLTHLLRTETGHGGITSYKKQMKRPVDPALVEDVVTWITAL